MLAKEMREERRTSIMKIHKYIFALAGHHLGLSNEDVEDFVLDDPSVSPDTTTLFGFLTSSSTTRLYRGRVPRLTSDNLCAVTHETERGNQDFCLSRSHYTDTDPTSRERVVTAGSDSRTSSPGVVRSTI